MNEITADELNGAIAEGLVDDRTLLSMENAVLRYRLGRLYEQLASCHRVIEQLAQDQPAEGVPAVNGAS